MGKNSINNREKQGCTASIGYLIVKYSSYELVLAILFIPTLCFIVIRQVCNELVIFVGQFSFINFITRHEPLFTEYVTLYPLIMGQQ